MANFTGLGGGEKNEKGRRISCSQSTEMKGGVRRKGEEKIKVEEGIIKEL